MVRRVMNDQGTKLDISDLLANTHTVELVTQIMQFDSSTDINVYFMKQEALWILINLLTGTDD
jgi:hypothetical protein